MILPAEALRESLAIQAVEAACRGKKAGLRAARSPRNFEDLGQLDRQLLSLRAHPPPQHVSHDLRPLIFRPPDLDHLGVRVHDPIRGYAVLLIQPALDDAIVAGGAG